MNSCDIAPCRGRSSYFCAAGVWQLATVVFIILGSFSLYWPAIVSGLHSDDWALSMAGTEPWKSFLGNWFGGGPGNFYRPLSRLLVYYEARWFGYSGLAQHVVSQLLFLGAVAFTALSVRRAAGFAGAVVTAVFLVTSPVATAAVCWVSSQTDLLAGFFATLCLYFVARHPRDIRWRHVGTSLVAIILCYLAKDSSATIGVAAGAYFVLVALALGFRRFYSYKPAFCWGLINVLLLGLYLGFRYWRLGQVAGSDQSLSFEPRLGMMWHINQLYLTVLRDMFAPFTSLVPAVPSDLVSRMGAWWPLFFTLGLVCWLYHATRYVEAILVVGFLVAIAPLSTLNIGFYPEMGMGEVRRFLYIPLFFAGAFIGILVSRANADGIAKARMHGLGVVLLLWLGFMQASVAQARIMDYYKAGLFRDQLVAKLNGLTRNGSVSADFHFETLPDKIGEAYCFRNGIGQMVPMLFAGSNAYTADTPGFMQLPRTSTREMFVLKAAVNVPIEAKNMKAEARLRERVRKAGGFAPDQVIYYQYGASGLNGLSTNPDAVVLGTERELLLDVTGRDAIISMPALLAKPYYLHKEAMVTVEFLDAKPPYKYGTAQFIWGLQGQTGNFSYMNAEVTLKPEKQTIKFNLDANPYWFKEGELMFARFDIPENYRGKLRVSAIGLR